MTWRWPNFTPEELRCRGTGELAMDDEFMDRLQALRETLGFALPVSSGYRTPEYNARASGTGLHGPHTTGHAVDIVISGPRVVRLVSVALRLGFTGVGVKQSGDHAGRFIHLDDLPVNGAGHPRPRIWSY